jgi:histidine triad (HIT) family protein
MTETCVFCRIIRGEERATRIYEDERVIAFMDNRPVTEGHSLIVSKKHYENIFYVPEEELAYLTKIVKKIAVAIKKSESPDGIRIIQNNGRAANQLIFHFHMHVIPVYEGKSLSGFRRTQEEDTLEVVAARIRRFI